MYRIILLFVFLFLIPKAGFSQNQKDSIRLSDKGKNPKTATLLSVFLPGAGQIYNGKYWKLPILYGGGFALGYFIRLNNSQYKLCRDSYLQVKAGEEDYFKGAYDADQLARLREYWRRNRDMLIIVSALTYVLNIADAAVDAHLSRFDVSDDLSLRWSPAILMAGNRPAPALSLRFDLH